MTKKKAVTESAFLGATPTYTSQDIKNIITDIKQGVQYTTSISPKKQINYNYDYTNNTGGVTDQVMFTVPNNQKFLITSIFYSFSCDSAAGIGINSAYLIDNNTNISLVGIGRISGSAALTTGSRDLNIPLEVEAGHSVHVLLTPHTTFTVVVTGYYIDIS